MPLATPARSAISSTVVEEKPCSAMSVTAASKSLRRVPSRRLSAGGPGGVFGAGAALVFMPPILPVGGVDRRARFTE